MKILLIICFCIFLNCELKANNNSEKTDTIDYKSKFNLGASYNKILNKDFLAMAGDYVYNPYKLFSIGLHWNVGTKRINNNFGREIVTPSISVYDIGIIYQYNFYQDRHIVLSFDFLQGFSHVSLNDESIKETHTDNSGNKSESAKEIDYDNYYFVSPGIEFCVHFDKRMGFTIKNCYRFLIGESSFGTKNDFSSYSLQLRLFYCFNF
jgi:hypothetical protein